MLVAGGAVDADIMTIKPLGLHRKRHDGTDDSIAFANCLVMLCLGDSSKRAGVDIPIGSTERFRLPTEFFGITDGIVVT